MTDGPIFKGYGWDIYKASEASEVVVFAAHRACNAHERVGVKNPMNSWWLGDNKKSCITCNAKVPDNIQALITLYTYGQETP